jgi:uncharacterized protein YfaS (alpha-2-macroglobulin family)
MSFRQNPNQLKNADRRSAALDGSTKTSKEQTPTKIFSKLFSLVLVASLLSSQLPISAQDARVGLYNAGRQRENSVQGHAPHSPRTGDSSQLPKNKSVIETELDDDHYTVSIKEVKSQSEEVEAQAPPLSAERTQALLANWSQYQAELPISKEPIEKNLITAALDRQPPPVVSPVQAFSSKTSAGRSNVIAPHTELTIASVSPMDAVSRVQTVRVQFSEQMVALSTIGSTTESPLDISISPPQKGQWEWLDPKTLQFKCTDDHFPMATSYTVQIGTNLKSVAETSLAAPFQWHFTTAPIESITVPPLDITKKYYIPLAFDQEVEPKEVFKHISLASKKHKLHATLVAEAEIRNEFPKLQDTNLSSLNRVYLKIEDILPPESIVEISVSKSCPSKEGPVLSDVVCKVSCSVGQRDKPVAAFAFLPAKKMSAARPIGENIRLNFNAELADVDIEKYVTVEPPLKNQKISRQNAEVIVSGIPLDKTTHKIHMSRDLPDVYGRLLPRDILIPLSFGSIPSILLNSGTNRREIIPSTKSSSYSIYTVNVPALRVRIFKRTEAQMYPKSAPIGTVLEGSESQGTSGNANVSGHPGSNDIEKENKAEKFPKPDKDFLIYPKAATNQICKSELQLADMLSNGHGQLRLIVQAYTKDAAQRTEKYLAEIAKSSEKSAAGKRSLKKSEDDEEKEIKIEKKYKAKKGTTVAPAVSSYNPRRAARNERLINARVGEQGGGRHQNAMNKENGILETSLQFTNLATSTIEGTDGKLYSRVTELDSGLPVAGAKVRFLRNPYVLKMDFSKKSDGSIIENVVECADDGQREASGAAEADDIYRSPIFTTDAQGLVAIPAAQFKSNLVDKAKNDKEWTGVFDRLGQSTPANIIVVSRDEDILYFENVQPGLTARDQNLYFCCTDRNLYKPGEKVDVKGWIRSRPVFPNADLQMCNLQSKRVYYSVHSSRKEVTTGDTELGYLGSLQFRLGLPVDMDLGNATIQIFTDAKHTNQLATVQFRVEEFRAPEFEVSVKKQDAAPKYMNEPTSFIVKSNYFGSGPLTGARVDWTVSLNNASFTPPNWGNFTFRNDSSNFRFHLRPPNRSKPQPQATLKGKTDKDGRHTLEVVATTYDGTQPMIIRAEGAVRDLSQQRWVASESCLLHPAAIYVGLTGDKTSVPQGDDLEGRFVTVDVDGKVIANTGIELQLFRQSERKENKDSAPIAVQTVTSSTEPMKFRIPCQNAGDYYVLAIAKDKRGRRHESSLSYSIYPGPDHISEDSQPIRKTERTFKVEANKQKYEPGDTAEITITCPTDKFTGWAALVSRGISKIIPFEGKNGLYVLNVPIESESIPQTTVRVQITTDKDVADTPLPVTWSSNLILPVSTKSRELTVVAKPLLSEILPGQNNTIDFKVSKADGTPAANADLCAIVVDEAVLAMTNYHIENPLASFYNFANFNQLLVCDSRPESVVGSAFNSAYHDWNSNLSPELIQQYWQLQGFNTNKGRIGFDVLYGQPIPFQRLVMGGGGLAQLASVDKFTFFPGPVPGYPQYSLGARLGPRDLNLFQVEPTTIDERHYTSGRSERHQKTIPTLPEGSPIPDNEGNDFSSVNMSPANNARIRTNFGPLALFKPNLKTDKDGRASVTFTAPDSLTRYRVIALVAEDEKYFGKAEANFTVDQPLTLRPSLPRFANVSDKFDVPIVVTNSGNKNSTIEIAGCAEGSAEGENGYTVDLEPNQRVSVAIHATSKYKGIAQVRCIARAHSGFADKIVRAIPVIESPTTEQFAQYGSISSGAVNEEIKFPDTTKTSAGRLDLKMSASAVTELHAAASYLKAYPYGCSEQLSSQILVFAAIKSMPKELGKLLASSDDLEREQDVVDELTKRMMPDGNFILWGGQQQTNTAPFLTAHCAHALLMAKEAGYKVDETVLKTTCGALRMPRFKSASDKQEEEANRRISAYLIFVRNLFGDELADEALKLLPDEKSIRDTHTEVICWLLPIIQKHDAEKAKQMLARLYNTTEETASTAFVQDKQSDVLNLFCADGSSRATALTLEALCSAAPDHPLIPKLAKGLLLKRGNGHWLNTNDDAFAFRALSLYFSLYEKENPNFAADAWLDGTHYIHGNFSKRTAAPMLATFKADENASIGKKNGDEKLPVASGAKNNLVLQAEGPGRLYYRIGLRYALKDPIQKSLDRGIQVSREYTGAYDRSEVFVQDDGTVLVKKGATVKITAHIYSPGERFYTALVDHLPAGFESVNTSLLGATQADNTQRMQHFILRRKPKREGDVTSAKKTQEKIYEAPYPDWNLHQNLRDDRTEVFRDTMQAGHYTYSYVARATTSGTFLAPPMKIEEMYTPETFGRSKSVLVKVVDELPPQAAEITEPEEEDENDDVGQSMNYPRWNRHASPTLPEGSPIPDNE